MSRITNKFCMNFNKTVAEEGLPTGNNQILALVCACVVLRTCSPRQLGISPYTSGFFTTLLNSGQPRQRLSLCWVISATAVTNRAFISIILLGAATPTMLYIKLADIELLYLAMTVNTWLSSIRWLLHYCYGFLCSEKVADIWELITKLEDGLQRHSVNLDILLWPWPLTSRI